MNRSEKLQLSKMINENNVQDFTEEIRKKKHSSKIRDDIKKLVRLKKTNTRLKLRSNEEYTNLLITNCSFLFNNYMDIFNKVKNDEINLTTLWKFLDVLKQIEDSKLDQHEGSFKVGQILKELYIDSAVKKADKLNHDREIHAEPKKEPKNISWAKYKNSVLQK